jgi:hypothetical protein
MSISLEELIRKLRPDKPKLEDSFKQALRFKLDMEISKLNLNPKLKSTINPFNFMNKFKLVLPAAAITAIAIVLAITIPKQQNQETNLLSKQEVTRLSANAFGSLANITNTGGRGGGMGGDTVSNKVAAPQTDVGMGGGSAGTMPSELYVPTYFKYIYKGDEFEVPAAQMEVYEREKGFGATANLGSFLSQFNIGLFNINKLQDATIEYIRGAENRDSGYAIDMDLKQGTISINQNWERWPVLDYSKSFSMDQIPADEVVIDIANRFLDEYGISRENFGEPEVQNTWRIMYENASNKAAAYLPDMLGVVYPTKIEGNDIYDQGGNKSGMMVYVNLRNNQVTSVSEITGQKYSASAYATETDTAKLIKLAESGGYQGYIPFANEDVNAKEVTVELGSPKLVYVRMWLTLNNQSKDIYVPSLIFPITNKPKDFYQQSVTVPLVKEVLDNQSIPPQILPMMDRVK